MPGSSRSGSLLHSSSAAARRVSELLDTVTRAVHLLLHASADVNALVGGETMQRYRGGTALHAALQTGNLGVVHTLLAAGADVEARAEPHEGGPSELFGMSACEIADAKGGEFASALKRTSRM